MALLELVLLVSHTNAETDVVVQLIQYYPWLFDVDREKLAVNDQISEVQEKLEQGVLGLKKSAGDIRTWIYSEIAAKEVSVEVGLTFLLSCSSFLMFLGCRSVRS